MRADLTTHLRALLIALGLYAAGALVWFAGPLLSIAGRAPLASERARVVAIGVVLLLFVAQLAWRALAASRRNRQMLDGLLPAAAAASPHQGAARAAASSSAPATTPAAAPGAPEVAVIGQRFAQALQVLRKRPIGGKGAFLGWLRRRPYVYELPWYIVIGAPGAGKTTTIVNSGLEFPFAAEIGPKALRGAGGTRNCDWWFTRDAVLIDTAGRYTTQDSYREADRAAWLGFLRLLRQHRPRQPINGVLLTLSATDLLQPDADKRRTLAREMRERIEELHAQLGIRFPIYVMVTKCDLLAGFAEFFADFDKDERAQVWGATLPLAAGGEPDAGSLTRLSSELVALEKSLHDCLIERLHDERDRERRNALFGFPQQWRVLREALSEMLQATFEAGGARPLPLLRGVYFTSATQEGSPMDRALGALSRALGLAHRMLPPGRPSGRAYFVTRLLREVILGEAGLAGTNRRWERQRAWLHGGVVALSALATVALLAWAGVEYRRSAALLAGAADAGRQLQVQAAAVKAAPADALAPMVPLLDGAWALVGAGARGDRSRAALLGLGQQADVLAAAQDTYHHLLREALVQRLARRLEQRLHSGGSELLTSGYEALKAYLMLFGGTHFDAAALRSYLLADLLADRTRGVAPPGSPPLQRALREHVERLLASGEVGAPSRADAQLVAATRQQVSAVPLAQRVLVRLRQADAGAASVPLSIDAAALPAARKVLARASGVPLETGVSALYTRAGQAGLRARVADGVRQLDGEAGWVLGVPTTPADGTRAQLVDGIVAQFAAERVQAWDALVDDLMLQPVSTLAGAAEQAQALSRADSPLLALLTAVMRDMGPVAVAATPTGAAPGADTAGATRELDALRRYLDDTPPRIEALQAAWGRAAVQLAAIDDAIARKAAAPPGDALRGLADAAAAAPEPLQSMLQQWAAAQSTLALGALRGPWSRQLAAEVTPACSKAVDGRYPVARQATQEMTRDEFVRTFGGGGVLDGFFQRHLAGWVDTTARPWSVRAPAGKTSDEESADAKPVGARASAARASDPKGVDARLADALLPFQRAQAIRSAFFADGGRQFGVRIELRLLQMDPGIGQLVLDIDGRPLRFARDTRGVQTLQWPGDGSGRIELQALAPGASSGSRFAFEGPWSLLHLFERVRIEPASGGRAVLVFDIEGRKVRLEAHAAHGPLAINLPELEQFQCPKRL
ncbi:MAG: type VI secretion system membrane subunit TssM [Ideonella sp.]|nr:type VI secretion system membrane subunit TssM [Ideonella sp.]MCC7455493.1 type VI secretion system membrane subunit TssM [Nitrospira sp.]